MDEPIHIPITNELDLHTFQASEAGDLLVDYLGECRKAGILSVRVVHGKGTGTLRTRVHGVLARMDIVESWTWPAGGMSGGWGATWVYLKPATGVSSCPAEAAAPGAVHPAGSTNPLPSEAGHS